jgi:hypothetical protein
MVTQAGLNIVGTRKLFSGDTYDKYKNQFISYGGGDEASFKKKVTEEFSKNARGHFPDNTGVTKWKDINKDWHYAQITVNGVDQGKVGVPRGSNDD